MKRIRIAAVIALLVTLPDVAQAVTRLPRLPTNRSLRHNLQVRPAEIDYTGDGSGELGGFDGTGRGDNYGHLHWTQWTPQQATGHGAVWINDFRPDRAAGHFHPYAVTVYATRARGGVFRRLTLRYRFHGRQVVDRRIVEHLGGGYTYGVVIPKR